jgi:acetyl esterase/lipase
MHAPGPAIRSPEWLDRASALRVGLVLGTLVAAVAVLAVEHPGLAAPGATSTQPSGFYNPAVPTPAGRAPGASARTGGVPVGRPVLQQEFSYRGQRATVQRPVAAGRHPVVYFVHGGFWRYGSRHQYDAEALIWAQRGWVAITLDYTLGTSYRGQLADLLAGIAHAERQPYADPARQVIVGDSAGGHLAALIATEHPRRFRAQILFSPVISPLNAYRDSQGAAKSSRRLGQDAARVVRGDWARADPSRRVSPSTPPVWLASSTADFVPYERQGRLLAAAMGGRASVHLVPGLRHGKSLEQGSLLRSARSWARAQIS